MDWKCAECGHDWEDHHDIEMSPGCRCMSCYEPGVPVACKVGADQEDGDPKCSCDGFKEKSQ